MIAQTILDVGSNVCIESLKPKTEHIISYFPIAVNKYRNMDDMYSVDEAAELKEK